MIDTKTRVLEVMRECSEGDDGGSTGPLEWREGSVGYDIGIDLERDLGGAYRALTRRGQKPSTGDVLWAVWLVLGRLRKREEQATSMLWSVFGEGGVAFLGAAPEFKPSQRMDAAIEKAEAAISEIRDAMCDATHEDPGGRERRVRDLVRRAMEADTGIPRHLRYLFLDYDEDGGGR